MNKQQLKAAEAAAIEGLAGAIRNEAKKAFYEANKAAIRAANDAEAIAKKEAHEAPEKALVEAAAVMGLEINIMANVGFFRGTSYDTAVLVRGDTFACKDVLKEHGAVWNSQHKCWVFNGTDGFVNALRAL